MRAKSAFGILLGMFLTVVAFAQDRPGTCQSDLQVAPGGSMVIDCKAQTEGYTYEWTSRDQSWLIYLSDVEVASPRFHAPVNVEAPLQLVYDRLVFDGEGALMHQATVTITVQEDRYLDSGGLMDNRWGEPERIGLDELGQAEIRAESMEELIGADGTMPDQVPFLRCESRVTADSGELVEIPCTGLHPSGGLLTYRFEYDWPPYNETTVLGEGTFAYLVRAPVIQGAASVQVLEVFAQVPGNGQEVSERVEVHIVNHAPKLVCEDITVDEGMQTAIPCSVTPMKAARIQLLSELAPRGVHDNWPMIAIPEVRRDTSFTVMVRVFGANGVSVVEDEFRVTVQNAQTPLDLDVSCNVDPYPLPYMEYEGAGPTELTISCGLASDPVGPLVWSLSADGGDTPIEPLNQILDIFQNPLTNEFTFVVALPQEVDGDVVWQYGVLVVENLDGGEEYTDREEINISILERPDISIDCDDVQVRTGDPPLELMCTPSLDFPHRDGAPDYQWSWTSGNGLGLLSGDLTSAMPVFNVPASQDPPTVVYTYQVTASADNTDPPQNPATLTVTVEKYLGKLALQCTSPIEVYAGEPDFPLDCTISGADVPDLAWTWQLQEGPEDRLVEGASGAPPIFRTPSVVEDTQTYKYEIRTEAQFYDTSDPQLVEIIVLRRPNLSIECDDIQVRTGDPPVELKCTPSLDVPPRDGAPDFLWSWTSENGLDLLSGDLASAMPVFNVPASQDPPTVEYTYQVTASADNIDPPQNPATLTVTVEKYLGKIAVQCTSPIEVYAGEPDFPLDCAISGADVPDLSWTWQLQEGPEDRLVEGASGAPPIFRTPEAVEDAETYKYEIQAEAPFYDASDPQLVEIIVLQRPQLSIECDDLRVRPGDPPVELRCTPSLDIPLRSGTPDYLWSWTSENGMNLLSGDLTSAMPVFNVPADQDPPTVQYTYQVTASADNIDPPQNPATLTVTVDKYPIFLVCPEEVVVTAGMSPQRIMCSATSELDAVLEYVWQWAPMERLLETSTGTPLFDVPARQRVYSRTYRYTVMVSAERGISAQASVSVIVLHPSQGLVEQVEVSSSELNFGVAGPDGEVLMDPATEQLSGLVYEVGQSHVGRMMVQARDSVTLSMEQVQSAVLRHMDSGRELTLVPNIAYSPSCTTFSAYTQASRIVQNLLAPGDCHVLRIGGSIALAQADPGVYSGKVSVVITVNGVDQIHTVPVELTVEPQRRVVLLGPDGVRFHAAPSTRAPLEWEQQISIQPQVAVLDPQTRVGTFELTNPSIHPMEVEVSTEFGYRETRGEDRFSIGVTDQEIAQGDLSALLTVHPKIVLLSPGETRPVHYAIPDHVQMQARGYAGQFNFTVTPREFVDQRQSPTSVQAARITFQAPGVYIPGPAQLRASVESRTSEAVVLLVETDTNPFHGDVIVYDDSGDELGRSEVLVYTRSRVHVPLNTAPSGGLMLRFMSSTLNQPSSSDVYIPSDS